MNIKKIISGGQTGVDRAALDVALELNIPCGGWCPRGRLAEDGRIDARYPLAETSRPEYAQRTRWNVRDSDGTLILTRGEPTGGTGLTRDYAGKIAKPCLVVDLANDDGVSYDEFADWIEWRSIEILNVAGPRESTCTGIAETTGGLLSEWLRKLREHARAETAATASLD